MFDHFLKNKIHFGAEKNETEVTVNRVDEVLLGEPVDEVLADLARLGDHLAEDRRRLGQSDEFVLQQLRGRGPLVRILHQTPANREKLG